MHPAWHWAAGCAIGLAIAVAGAPHRASPHVGELLAPTIGDNDDTSGVTVVAVVQPADCAGRLASLDAVAHAARATGARLTLAVLAPTAAHEPLVALSRTRHWNARVVHAPNGTARALRQLGVEHSPTLLVLGANGALRWAEPLPETPTQLLRWRQLLPLVFAS